MNEYTIKRNFKILYNSIGKYWWKKPTIKSIDETIDYIRERHCSVSRFGDGEFEMMLGYGNGFQCSNDELSHRLRQVIMMPVDNHIVCLPDIFGDLSMLNEKSLKYNTELMKKRRRQYLNLLDIDRTYYNSFFTRFYDMFAVKSNSCRWAEKNKEIWGGVDILIVEGRYSRLGVGNDLFAKAKSVQRILGPEKEAFNRYDELLASAKQYGKNKLILIALGMTATVLAYDLAKEGYWAIDIGHIDIEYEWFLHKATEKTAIKGKYVNEVAEGKNVSDNVDPRYWNEIIDIAD